RQCVAGGRVAVPWIATVFGVAERTVQRAMHTLQRCGWLARVPVQPGRERPHGRYTVLNLAWQRPGATDRTQQPHAAATPEEPVLASCHTMSPVQGGACHKMSPMEAHLATATLENTQGYEDHQPALFQPFQEESQDPEPTERGPTGASTQAGQDA